VWTDELLTEWERVIVREGKRTPVHIAACAFGGATVLLTRNERDFPRPFLVEHGVTVSSADTYLTGLLRPPAGRVRSGCEAAGGPKQRPPRVAMRRRRQPGDRWRLSIGSRPPTPSGLPLNNPEFVGNYRPWESDKSSVVRTGVRTK
jgi:hypothetical protein